jgi:hypothetical protein
MPYKNIRRSKKRRISWSSSRLKRRGYKVSYYLTSGLPKIRS